MMEHVSNAEEQLRDEVNKRLTLNWLIQGAAVHAGRSAHHLILEEWNACSPKLPRLYDCFGIAMQLQYWRGEFALRDWIGRCFRFLVRRSRQLTPEHRLSVLYGNELANSARLRTLARAKEKCVPRIPIIFSYYIVFLLARLRVAESRRGPRIEALARKTAAMVFDIPVQRLQGRLVARRSLDRRRFPPPHSLAGLLFAIGIVSWNDVEICNGVPTVRAQAINGSLLTSELVKGTAELICMHGLNELEDEMYAQIIKEADRIEYEPWMIKTGGELWRRLLVMLPVGSSIAHVLMNMARLSPADLESLIELIIQQSPAVTLVLANLAKSK